MSDDLTIPDFLRRPWDTTKLHLEPRRPRRQKKIPYPKDGYKCVGMRAAARAKHKARLTRRAERMRRR